MSISNGGRTNALDIVRRLSLPPGLRYTREHVWVRLAMDAKGLCMMGVTEIVTRRYLTMTRIELLDDFRDVSEGDVVATIVGISQFDQIEVSFPVVSPLTGTICPTNSSLRKRFLRRAKPDLIRLDPYAEGWILGIVGDVEEQLHTLMDSSAYLSFLQALVEKDPALLYRDTR